MTSKTVNRAQIAAVFGVSVVTIDRWVNDGMPAVKNGRLKAGNYDIAACVQWRLKKDSEKLDTDDTIEAARLRKTNAEADKLEFEFSTIRGEYMTIAEFKQLVSSEKSRVQAFMLSVPNKIMRRITQYLHDKTEAKVIHSIIENEITEAMNTASSEE